MNEGLLDGCSFLKTTSNQDPFLIPLSLPLSPSSTHPLSTAQVRNDYCLSFDAAAEVEPCEGDGGIALAAPRLDLVPIEALLAHVDKKAPVDLLGVVTAVQPLGSVKRKADDSKVARRDVTLVGRGCAVVGWLGGSWWLAGARVCLGNPRRRPLSSRATLFRI